MALPTKSPVIASLAPGISDWRSRLLSRLYLISSVATSAKPWVDVGWRRPRVWCIFSGKRTLWCSNCDCPFLVLFRWSKEVFFFKLETTVTTHFCYRSTFIRFSYPVGVNIAAEEKHDLEAVTAFIRLVLFLDNSPAISSLQRGRQPGVRYGGRRWCAERYSGWHCQDGRRRPTRTKGLKNIVVCSYGRTNLHLLKA